MIFKDKEIPTVMFEGKPDKGSEISSEGNITFYSHLAAPRMKKIIEGSDSIISRSGYTTIMELVSLNCKALIIPTPGQPEQEYLAKYLTEKGWFCTVSQEEIKGAIPLCPNKIVRHGEMNRQSRILLTQALRELLEKHHKKSQPGKT